ncbi:MAG TPA: hypothetical protein VJB89_04130 [Candidatus Nanoarchaeia archaeon]|nr:hypothetical protein [Candidatus Nanoarchaeia archaeon]
MKKTNVLKENFSNKNRIYLTIIVLLGIIVIALTINSTITGKALFGGTVDPTPCGLVG